MTKAIERFFTMFLLPAPLKLRRVRVLARSRLLRRGKQFL